MKHAGDQPGKGTYVCMICGKKVIIEKDDEKLRGCSKFCVSN
jgi:DNA-directed RNA polymerase subunit RPC12/RpoP